MLKNVFQSILIYIEKWQDSIDVVILQQFRCATLLKEFTKFLEATVNDNLCFLALICID